MRIVISHAGGIANVWLNLVKLLIGLVFAYQQVLSDQLGLSGLLSLNLDVLTLGEVVIAPLKAAVGRQPGEAAKKSTGQNRNQHVHQITSVNDIIDVPFVPISREKYRKLDVVITGIDRKIDGKYIRLAGIVPTKGSSAVFCTPPKDQSYALVESVDLPKCEFRFPESGVGARAIRVAGFRLSELLCQSELDDLERKTRTSDEVEVEFGLHYRMSAEYPNGEILTVGNNDVPIAFQLPGSTTHEFDISIVEGQSGDLPEALRRDKNRTFRGTRQPVVRNDKVVWSPGLRIGINDPPFRGTYTDAKGEKWEFELRVYGITNRPPRQLRGEYVGLIPRNRYDAPEAPAGCYRWMYLLSDYIVDPDGVGPNGPDFGRYGLTIEDKSFAVNDRVVSGPCPYIVAPYGDSQWRLYRLNNGGPVKGSTESLVVIAKDLQGKTQRIEVRIVS